jgi:hypothetical protein
LDQVEAPLWNVHHDRSGAIWANEVDLSAKYAGVDQGKVESWDWEGLV